MALNLERLLYSTGDGSGPVVGAHILNTSIAVTASDLDIRDLTAASDSVKIGDGTNFLAIESDGSLNVNATISATDLDIRDLVYTSDSVTAHQGGTWSVTASATDLDIRDLVYTSDSVTAHQGGTWSVTASATDLDIRDLVYTSDSVTSHQGGTWSVSTDFLPDAAVASAAVSVAATATALPSSPLSGRKRIYVQNQGSVPVYVGPSGVSASSGLEIPKGGTLSLEIGPTAVLYGIVSTGTCAVRVFEQS